MGWSKGFFYGFGFTDFKWKKNRFLKRKVGEIFSIRSDYRLYDRVTENKWWIAESANNDRTLASIINNLYERNGYLRRECSKQHFLSKKHKEEADFWKKMYKEKDIEFANERQESDYWYNAYVLLKNKVEQENKDQEIDWDELKKV